MEVNFRFLNPKDRTTYQSLRLASYQEAPFAFSESYEDELDRPVSYFAAELEMKGHPPEWFVLGAFSEREKLIGFVKFRRDLRSKARHKSMIHAMYVAPEYRKYGIGKGLIDQLLISVKELENLEQIHLWVLHADGSVSASDFYKKCGFISQGPLVKKDLKIGETYIDAEYMVMYL